MRTLMIPVIAALSLIAARPANAGGCHTETRYRTEYRTETQYQQQWVVETVCGVNVWGVYGCAPVGHWVSVPVTVTVPYQEAYTVTVCE